MSIGVEVQNVSLRRTALKAGDSETAETVEPEMSVVVAKTRTLCVEVGFASREPVS